MSQDENRKFVCLVASNAAVAASIKRISQRYGDLLRRLADRHFAVDDARDTR